MHQLHKIVIGPIPGRQKRHRKNLYLTQWSMLYLGKLFWANRENQDFPCTKTQLKEAYWKVINSFWAFFCLKTIVLVQRSSVSLFIRINCFKLWIILRIMESAKHIFNHWIAGIKMDNNLCTFYNRLHKAINL